MFSGIHTGQLLCLDIETVPQYPQFDAVPREVQDLWFRKAANLKKDEGVDEAAIYPRAGIYAEFGKIICISTGFLVVNGAERQFRMRSFYGDDERILLQEFGALLQQIHDTRMRNNQPPMLLAAHNGKEFDFPYIARRMVIHSIPLPPQLDLYGKKPWEVPHIDTMELWKFGDYKNFTPLNLLAHVLGIPSPKDDIDGSQVGEVYWKDKDLDRIEVYCRKDVVTVMQIVLRLKGENLLIPDEINVV